MVIMLAKTAGISEDYYDAANIDGASQFQKDLHITAPLIKSTFFLCIILAVIFNLRQFEYVYLMTAGGPANKTQVLVVYIWNELSVQRLGRGNAAGVIMIAIGAILLLSLRKLLKVKPITKMQRDLSSNFYFIFKWVIIISFVFYAVFPFLWLVLASLKTNAELLDDPFKLPAVFQFQNYSNAIREAGLGKLIINSLVISTSATFLNILFSSCVCICNS